MKHFLRMVVLYFLLFSMMPIFAEDTKLRVTINVNAYDRKVSVKVNGTEIKKITGGHAHAKQLFHKNHPMLKDAPKEFKEIFCLKEGKNTIEISHSTMKGKIPSTLEISIQAIGYSVPLLKYIQKSNIKEAVKELHRQGILGKREDEFINTFDNLLIILHDIDSKKGSHPPMTRNKYDAELALDITNSVVKYIVNQSTPPRV